MITEEFSHFLRDPSTTKVLATTDAHGTPHLTFDDSLHIDADDRLVYLEFEEFSQTNKNLVRAIWFHRTVAIHVQTVDGHCFEVVGVPWKCLIAGPVYERYYRQSREDRGDVGLSSVWLIDPIKFSEETPMVRAARDGVGRIPLIHLDRLARRDEISKF